MTDPIPNPHIFREQHPCAGGREHYTAYLETDNGFEGELGANNSPERE
ncbi:hypothetical protein [Streptomyces venetus]